MKSQLGKPTGLALALLSTLLATFLAMGVFSVALADNHSATRSFSTTAVALGDDVVVTIKASNYGSFGNVKETVPEGFSMTPAAC